MPTERPPIAGPTTRERLNCIEFNAMPCRSCSGFTSSPIKVCHAGKPTELNVPFTSAITIICQTVMMCNVVKMPSNADVVIYAVCVIISSQRRLKRSAITPPNSDSTILGNVAENTTRPSNKAELVSCKTCQPCPTVCIQKPMLERNAPDQNKAKFLSFNGSNAEGNIIRGLFNTEELAIIKEESNLVMKVEHFGRLHCNLMQRFKTMYTYTSVLRFHMVT